MVDVSRRGFLGILAGAVAVPTVATSINVPVYNGTPIIFDSINAPDYVVCSEEMYGYISEIIVNTINNNSHLIADNVSMNNALFLKLKTRGKAHV